MHEHILNAARELISQDALAGVLRLDSMLAVNNGTEEVHRMMLGDTVTISGV